MVDSLTIRFQVRELRHKIKFCKDEICRRYNSIASKILRRVSLNHKEIAWSVIDNFINVLYKKLRGLQKNISS